MIKIPYKDTSSFLKWTGRKKNKNDNLAKLEAEVELDNNSL